MKVKILLLSLRLHILLGNIEIPERFDYDPLITISGATRGGG